MDRVLSQFEDVLPQPTATPGAAAWIAREPNAGRQVLIKRLADDAARTRATQSLALSHPAVVPTRRWLRDEGAFYVVRDFVPGVNLRQRLADASLRAFDRMLLFLSPVLDALDYAHQSGLPHGGVTPENVLIDEQGQTLLSDFATTITAGDGQPTARADFYDLCQLYKDFLPERARDDEAGAAARARLIRNLTETQQTAASADELRYKLDAVGKMAELLGFASGGLPMETVKTGAKIICAVSPPTAILNPGGGAAVNLLVRNEGDATLHVEAVGSDVVWLNVQDKPAPFELRPDSARDIGLTISGARLRPGTYNANILVRSNAGLLTLAPEKGAAWHEQIVGLPVLVKGAAATEPNAPPPLAERLPEKAPEKVETPGGEHPGIACTQEPDPALVRQGQIGVVHVGVKNAGSERLRVDKLSTRPSWLSYPGEFAAVWIEPGATQYLGFSVISTHLTGGDYKAEIKFVTSTVADTMLGPQPVWREMKCEVRVRVVRVNADGQPAAPVSSAGCASVLLGILSSLGLLGLAMFLLLSR